MRQIAAEVKRVFGGHTDEPVFWVVGPHGRYDVRLVIMPGGDGQNFEMRFSAYPDRAAAKSLALSTLRRMSQAINAARAVDAAGGQSGVSSSAGTASNA